MLCAVVEPRFQRTIMLCAVVEPRFQRTRMHCALSQFKTKREPRSANVRSSTLSSCFFEFRRQFRCVLVHEDDFIAMLSRYMSFVTPQNVITIAAKCNTNTKCNNINAKCNKIINAKCNNFPTQNVITFLTQNEITQIVVTPELQLCST